jgi:hypothetical protein
MKELHSPPPKPVHWFVKIGDVAIMSPPCRTAFAAAASVRTERGVPAFSECEVMQAEREPTP